MLNMLMRIFFHFLIQKFHLNLIFLATFDSL